MAGNINNSVLTMNAASPVDRANKMTIQLNKELNGKEPEPIPILAQNRNFETFKAYTSKIENIINK